MRLVEALVPVDLAHETRERGLGVGAEDVRAEDLWDVTVVLEQSLFKYDLATDVDNVAARVAKEAFGVDKATLAVHRDALLILEKDVLAAGVHLDVAEDAVDVEASEGEDLGEFTIPQLRLEEEYLTLARANVSISSHDVASLVDHEASFVDKHLVTAVVFAHEQLDLASTVAVEDSHHFL